MGLIKLLDMERSEISSVDRGSTAGAVFGSSTEPAFVE